MIRFYYGSFWTIWNWVCGFRGAYLIYQYCIVPPSVYRRKKMIGQYWRYDDILLQFQRGAINYYISLRESNLQPYRHYNAGRMTNE